MKGDKSIKIQFSLHIVFIAELTEKLSQCNIWQNCSVNLNI